MFGKLYHGTIKPLLFGIGDLSKTEVQDRFIEEKIYKAIDQPRKWYATLGIPIAQIIDNKRIGEVAETDHDCSHDFMDQNFSAGFSESNISRISNRWGEGITQRELLNHLAQMPSDKPVIFPGNGTAVGLTYQLGVDFMTNGPITYQSRILNKRRITRSEFLAQKKSRVPFYRQFERRQIPR